AAPSSTPSTPHALQAPFDAATRTEVDKIATESAKHVVEEWSNPHLRKQEAARTAAAAGAAVATAAYDRDARREVLIQQRLDALNQNRFTDQLTDLDDAQKAAIEHELDLEEAATGGVVTQTSTPTGPVYRRNSPEAWVHAITGMNAEYGLGLTGFRDKYAPGSEKSWFRERTEEEKKDAERPLANRLLDATGLSSVEAENQFSPSTWFEEKDSGSQAPHEEWKYGKPNPDGAMIDVSRLDLDELANRLYDRVRSRLRIELLVDRERAGLLTDFR
ncbi:MAG: hypothetical protein M3422_04450, partial [Actinomycetota bacterium]|nr:hypothetical protein [Actinomycetota bacterium]